MFCPNCGLQLVSGATSFCLHCGSPIKRAAPTTAPVATQGPAQAPALAQDVAPVTALVPAIAIEQYAIGTPSESAGATLEEHLLICPECQNRLQKMDEYVKAMRSAAAKIRDSEEPK